MSQGSCFSVFTHPSAVALSLNCPFLFFLCLMRPSTISYQFIFSFSENYQYCQRQGCETDSNDLKFFIYLTQIIEISRVPLHSQ